MINVVFDGVPPPAKPKQGPSWRKDLRIGQVWSFEDGFEWEVIGISDRGRDVRWRCKEDGRVARTVCAPTHPDYPPDPTPEQLRKESLERLHARPTRYTY